jgi:Protein of unknown function (DUF4012)
LTRDDQEPRIEEERPAGAADPPAGVGDAAGLVRASRRRRRIGWAMLLVGGLIVLAGVWLVVTGLMARGQLDRARADVYRLRAQLSVGELAGARTTADALAAHSRRAHELTTGPLWAFAATVPAGGEPVRTIRGITASIDDVGRKALPDLVSASETLDPTKLRGPAGEVDLARVDAAAPRLDGASKTVSRAITTVVTLPAHTWLSTIDTARADLLTQLTSLGATIQAADRAAHVAPVLLGQDGRKTYLVSFETEAELRGTGGLPGAFAIVQADHGKVSFSRFESDVALTGVPSGLNFGADYDQLYAGANATAEYSDSNVSPHFPYAAQIWVAMWQKESGQHLDGAMAVDPTALSYLLEVAGPATMPDGTQISADNVVDLTARTLYAKFAYGDQAGRKSYQLQMARAIGEQLLDGRVSTASLVRAAGRAVGERRLLLWSADPPVEAQLSQTALGGTVLETAAPYVGLSINNAAANKLDYYLTASLGWERHGCGTTGPVTVTITIKNGAPADLPKYVLGDTGRRGFPQRPGDNRLLVGYFATQGAQLTSISLNGKPSAAQVGSERRHPVYTVELGLPRGETQTIVLHLREPRGAGSPIVLRQPMVTPLTLSVDAMPCR